LEFRDIFKYIVAIGGSLVTYLFGGWSALIQILVAFVVVDYITGVLAAGINGKLNSNIGTKGIAKKIFIFVIVACGHLVDGAMGTNDIVRDAAIYFYIANELISILENAGETGLPVPDILKDSIDRLKGKEKNEDTPG
jgi:toxin secretion/phage lysis holin